MRYIFTPRDDTESHIILRLNEAISEEIITTIAEALQKPQPLANILIDNTSGIQIPLDLYLANIQCRLAHPFSQTPIEVNVWGALPYILRESPDKISISPPDAQKVLARFNAYTWNEHEPELRKAYFTALSQVSKVAREPKGDGWNGGSNPDLTLTLEKLLAQEIFETIPSYQDTVTQTKIIKDAEKAYTGLPKKKFREYVNPLKWVEIRLQDEQRAHTIHYLRQAADEMIIPLRALGMSYREAHIRKYYPNLD